ncbi:MAG: SRPBCC domain-containing protein [Opitutales bacterium]
MLPCFAAHSCFETTTDNLWRAISEEDVLVSWFHPKGCSIVQSSLDLYPEGIFHYKMQGPDGGIFWGRWLFTRVEPSRNLAFRMSFSAENKNEVVRSPWDPSWPLEVHSVFRIHSVKDAVKLSVSWSPWQPSPEEAHSFERTNSVMSDGWAYMFSELRKVVLG